ncbi:hypothetical protein Tco_1442594 [Tanacetum coccineum]
MTIPKFAEMHNVAAFLEKPVESYGFTEIIDFLKASSVHYALTSQAFEVIFTWKMHKVQLARMGAKSTAWNEFSSTMASLIICLATNQNFNLSKYIFDAMVKHLDVRVKFLMYPCFLQVFINQQLGDMSHHKKIFVNHSHTKKDGKDFSGRITPLFDTMMVQASEEVGEDSDHPTDSNQIPIVDQPSTSSQSKQKQKSKRRQRNEAEVPQDETEHEESVSTPSNDP